MSNTKIQIMAFLIEWDAWQPSDIVTHLWPKSKQPEKKAKTITAHLSVLKRFGYVVEIQGQYYATKPGRLAFWQMCREVDGGYELRKTVPFLKVV